MHGCAPYAAFLQCYCARPMSIRPGRTCRQCSAGCTAAHAAGDNALGTAVVPRNAFLRSLTRRDPQRAAASDIARLHSPARQAHGANAVEYFPKQGLTYAHMRDIIYFVRAARRVSIDVRPWLSWIERLATDQKVGGSNPSGRANRKHANLDERLACFSFTRFLTASAALPPGERIVGFPRRALKRLVPVPCYRRGTLLDA